MDSTSLSESRSPTHTVSEALSFCSSLRARRQSPPSKHTPIVNNPVSQPPSPYSPAPSADLSASSIRPPHCTRRRPNCCVPPLKRVVMMMMPSAALALRPTDPQWRRGLSRSSSCLAKEARLSGAWRSGCGYMVPDDSAPLRIVGSSQTAGRQTARCAAARRSAGPQRAALPSRRRQRSRRWRGRCARGW